MKLPFIDTSYVFLVLVAYNQIDFHENYYICNQNTSLPLTELEKQSLQKTISQYSGGVMMPRDRYNFFWSCEAHHSSQYQIDQSASLDKYRLLTFHLKRKADGSGFSFVSRNASGVPYSYKLSQIGPLSDVVVVGLNSNMIEEDSFLLLPTEVTPLLSVAEGSGTYSSVASMDIKMKPLPPPSTNPYMVYYNGMNVTNQTIDINEHTKAFFQLKKMTSSGDIINITYCPDYNNNDPDTNCVRDITWRVDGAYYSAYSNLSGIEYIVPKFGTIPNDSVELRSLIGFHYPLKVNIKILDVPIVAGFFPDTTHQLFLCDSVSVLELVNAALDSIEAKAALMYNKVQMNRHIDIEMAAGSGSSDGILYGQANASYTNFEAFFVDENLVKNWGDPPSYKDCPIHDSIFWMMRITENELDSILLAIDDTSSFDIPYVVTDRIAKYYSVVADSVIMWCQATNMTQRYRTRTNVYYQAKKLAYKAPATETAIIGVEDIMKITLWVENLNNVLNYIKVEDNRQGTHSGGQNLEQIWYNQQIDENDCEAINSVRLEKYIGTIAHEIAHLCYSIEHPSESFKWTRVKSQRSLEGCYPYPIEGYCSMGSGHEYQNPEGVYTCTVSEMFPNPIRTLD